MKILGIKKGEHFNYLIFPKVQQFFPFFRKMLKALGEDGETAEGFGRPMKRNNYEYNLKKEYKINRHTDKHYYFIAGDYLIEVVFGKNRIFVSIHTKKDRQKEIARIIKKLI